MPGLDRRVIVRRSVETSNQFGETVTTDTDYPLWAGVSDLSAFDVESEGGTFTKRLRKWTIRWRSDLEMADTSELTVVDGEIAYDVTNVVRQQDGKERRKMMILEGVAIP